MIEIRDLTKSYGEIAALRGISASIGRGEVVGLLGPNGAGKTTTMKILAGFLRPTSGEARVAGFDPVTEPLAVQSRIGYLPENAPLYHDMLVQDMLLFVASVRGLTRSAAVKAVGRAIDRCRIGDVLTRPIGQLSKGYRQRVGLAGAILHDPEILILDEPTNGLDPNQIVEVRELIRQLGQTKTVIVSTHILPEVEATCDRAIVIMDGSIRADGRLADLTRATSQIVTVRCSPAEGKQAFGCIAGVTRVEATIAGEGFTTFRLDVDSSTGVADGVWEATREKSWALRELRRDDRTLEQLFRELTAPAGEVHA